MTEFFVVVTVIVTVLSVLILSLSMLSILALPVVYLAGIVLTYRRRMSQKRERWSTFGTSEFDVMENLIEALCWPVTLLVSALTLKDD